MIVHESLIITSVDDVNDVEIFCESDEYEENNTHVLRKSHWVWQTRVKENLKKNTRYRG